MRGLNVLCLELQSSVPWLSSPGPLTEWLLHQWRSERFYICDCDSYRVMKYALLPLACWIPNIDIGLIYSGYNKVLCRTGAVSNATRTIPYFTHCPHNETEMQPLSGSRLDFMKGAQWTRSHDVKRLVWKKPYHGTYSTIIEIRNEIKWKKKPKWGQG